MATVFDIKTIQVMIYTNDPQNRKIEMKGIIFFNIQDPALPDSEASTAMGRSSDGEEAGPAGWTQSRDFPTDNLMPRAG